MRFTKLIFVGAVLFAAPALAQAPNGNVGQPSRAVPQAGSTTGGPLDNPSSRDMAPASGAAMRPAGEAGMAPGAGAVDSAKSGNADQTNKPVSNTGSTSGGPAR